MHDGSNYKILVSPPSHQSVTDGHRASAWCHAITPTLVSLWQSSCTHTRSFITPTPTALWNLSMKPISDRKWKTFSDHHCNYTKLQQPDTYRNWVWTIINKLLEHLTESNDYTLIVWWSDNRFFVLMNSFPPSRVDNHMFLKLFYLLEQHMSHVSWQQ